MKDRLLTLITGVLACRTLAVAICAHPRTIASTDWPLPQVACLSAPPSRTCFPSRPNSTRCLPERR